MARTLIARVAALSLTLAAGGTLAAPPTKGELAQRDAWILANTPKGEIARPHGRGAENSLVIDCAYGPVIYDRVLDRALQVANHPFAHGVYTHAPARLHVRIPHMKTFSAQVGILDNPNSVGGSTICSIEVGGKKIASSPVLHRDQPAVPLTADLGDADTLVMQVSTTGDGISSDQTVWGEASVTLTDGSQVRLSSLPMLDPLTEARSASAVPFSFTIDGTSSDTLLPAWRWKDEAETRDGAKRTRVRTYTDPGSGLQVRHSIVSYDDYPTVEWTISFKNTGAAESPLISGVLPLNVDLPRPASGDFRLHHFIGSPCQPNDYEPLEDVLGPGASKRITTQGGRPTNSDLPYFNIERENGGVIAAISWAGQWDAQFTRDAGGALRVVGGQEGTAFRLHPGEEARSPLVVLQFYEGDWVRAQNVWRAWMIAHNVPRHQGKQLGPMQFVCNGNYYPGLRTDAATELKFLERYYREGIKPDFWNQDAGWYPCEGGWWPVGTWAVDTARFPKGVREVTDYLHAHGSKSIMWFEPERVVAGTEIATQHPEWVYGGAGGGLLKLGEPECRAWITDRVDKVIGEQGIDFYRQDFNFDPLVYWRGNDTDDRQGLTEIHHVEGYFAYWDELVRRHPDLWIDSCASGGRRNDLETLRRAMPILRSDWTPDPSNPATDPAHQQNHMYGISFWMPYNGTGYGTIDKYLARSVMTTIHGIGVDTRRDDLDYSLLRELYGNWRTISACYLGDYWPLTAYSKELNVWCAYQFDLADEGRGVVQAFRRKDCGQDSIVVKLRGLDANATYELTDLDAAGVKRTGGKDLMETGLSLSSPQTPNAMIVTYRRVDDAARR
ncbi:MAG: alpha-galactosidase [Phycisphaerales bacterium]